MESENFQRDPASAAKPAVPGSTGSTGSTARSAARRPWRTLLVVLFVGGGLAWISYRFQAATTDRFQPTLRWQTDSDQALAAATQADQPVLMVFTQPGCIYCRRLEKQVLETPAFEAVAKGRVVLAMLDVTTRRHLDLLRGFGGAYVPTVVLTDPADNKFCVYQGDGKDLVAWLTTRLTTPRVAPPPPSSQPATRPAG